MARYPVYHHSDLPDLRKAQAEAGTKKRRRELGRIIRNLEQSRNLPKLFDQIRRERQVRREV
jgi:hypothetical protein